MEKYYCFSQRLMRALTDNGFEPLYIENYTESDIRAVYEKTEALVNFIKNEYQSVRDKY